MTRRADFNAEEWATVVEGPLLAGMRVVTADRGGTLRESLAMGQTYAKARQQQGQSELLDELVASPPALDPSRLQGGADLTSMSTQRLRDAVQLLEDKASPEELEAYRSFVMSVAQAVASAHREGGVLGLGGKEISPSEQAALDDIAATLRAA